MPWEGNLIIVAKTEKYKGNHPVVLLRSFVVEVRVRPSVLPETAILEQHTCCNDLSILASSLHPEGVGWC